jgi:hypothetical protein
MQDIKRSKANGKPSYLEFRMLWLISFFIALPGIAIKRLLPTQWRHWRRDKNIFTVVREAREFASTVAPMAFQAY